jgi:hypothetical protein
MKKLTMNKLEEILPEGRRHTLHDLEGLGVTELQEFIEHDGKVTICTILGGYEGKDYVVSGWALRNPKDYYSKKIANMLSRARAIEKFQRVIKRVDAILNEKKFKEAVLTLKEKMLK